MWLLDKTFSLCMWMILTQEGKYAYWCGICSISSVCFFLLYLLEKDEDEPLENEQ